MFGKKVESKNILQERLVYLEDVEIVVMKVPMVQLVLEETLDQQVVKVYLEE